jgi:type IV fimbrial biogenesis protein FimT
MQRIPSKESDTKQRGFTLIELSITLVIVLIVATIAIPNFLRIVYNIRLRSAAADLAGLMQQARITAAKNNTTYAVKYSTSTGGARVGFIDLNGDGNLNSGEPLVQFTGTVSMASGTPPAPYVLSGDTSSGSAYTNSRTLGFSSRGLPCDFSSPPTCITPSANYFVYYLTDTRIGTPGWAAVVVTKAGRTKVATWSGSTWN